MSHNPPSPRQTVSHSMQHQLLQFLSKNTRKEHKPLLTWCVVRRTWSLIVSAWGLFSDSYRFKRTNELLLPLITVTRVEWVEKMKMNREADITSLRPHDNDNGVNIVIVLILAKLFPFLRLLLLLLLPNNRRWNQLKSCSAFQAVGY